MTQHNHPRPAARKPFRTRALQPVMTDAELAQQRADEAFAASYDANFVPVPMRQRHDGWSPMRQVAFIEALAQSGCVREAAASVGLSVASAYRLRQHSAAETFRAAWDLAIDRAMDRLVDAALSRAINGVARPIVHQGEIIGERRYYDERLTQFLLRTRRPGRFGRWTDAVGPQDEGELAARVLAAATARLATGKDDPDLVRAVELETAVSEGRAKGGAGYAADDWRAYAKDA